MGTKEIFQLIIHCYNENNVNMKAHLHTKIYRMVIVNRNFEYPSIKLCFEKIQFSYPK